MESPQTYSELPGAYECLSQGEELTRLFEAGELSVNELRAAYGLPPLKD